MRLREAMMAKAMKVDETAARRRARNGSRAQRLTTAATSGRLTA
jgi:hypothetical protein